MKVLNVGERLVVDSFHFQPQAVVAFGLLPPAEQRRKDVERQPTFVADVDDPAVQKPVDGFATFPTRPDDLVNQHLLLPPPFVGPFVFRI